jgi:hypothetical protein
MHWRTGARVIMRWAKETGIEMRGMAGHMQPAPDNWAELCAQYTLTQMRHKRRWGSVIVNRWAKETGIAPRVYVKPEKAAPKPKKATPFEGRGMPLKSCLNTRLRSIWDESADLLRAERWVVFRSNEKGGADAKGMYWRVGWIICTPDDLLMRAERYRRKAASWLTGGMHNAGRTTGFRQRWRNRSLPCCSPMRPTKSWPP